MTYAVGILLAEKQRLEKERREDAESFSETKEFIEAGGADAYVDRTNLIRDLDKAIEILEEEWSEDDV